MGKDLAEMANVLKGVPEHLQPIFKEVRANPKYQHVCCVQLHDASH